MKKQNEKIVDIEFLPSGLIRFQGKDSEYNDSLFPLLKEMVGGDGEEIKNIQIFFEQSEECELIFGKNLFCG